MEPKLPIDNPFWSYFYLIRLFYFIYYEYIEMYASVNYSIALKMYTYYNEEQPYYWSSSYAMINYCVKNVVWGI